MKIRNIFTSVKRKILPHMFSRFCIIFFVISLQAQDAEPPAKIQDLELPCMTGAVNVYYSKGFTDRAAYLQELAESASAFFRKPEIIDVKVDLNLAVLGPEDWVKITQLPYGVSHVNPEPPMAVVPASKDNVISNAILESKDHIPDNIIMRLDELEFTIEDAAPAFVDLISFHEIGHIYSYAYGTSTWPSLKWLEEFTATYLAYSFMKKEKPELAELWDIMTDALGEDNGNEHTTLVDFEELYVGVGISNYGWYQAKFQQKVAEVHEKMGISFIHALKKILAVNPEAQQDDPFRLKELDTIFNGFTYWADGPDGNLK